MSTAVIGMTSPRSNPITEAPEILELIESQSWTEIIRKLQDEPKDAGILLDSSTGRSNLAIHEACKHQPPVAVIESFIKANPSSVMAKGELGYLPIHFAVSTSASKAVVAKLIEANPACVRSRDKNEERLPLHVAAKWGAPQDVILTIMTHHPEGVFIRDKSGNTPMDYAKILASHRRMEVVKALKQGPLLSAVSKAAMQRATIESTRSQRPSPDARESISSQVKAAKAEAEKTYASIVAKMEANHKQEIEMLKASKAKSEKELEAKYLGQITEAQKEAVSEREAKEALKLTYEAELALLKDEASQHKEEIVVSNRKIEEFNHSECLSVSTLPLRQKIKSISSELEQEWQNNSKLTKENEALKETNIRVESKLNEQTKIMEALKTKVLTKSEDIESKEAVIDMLKKDITEREAKIATLLKAKTAINLQLEDQMKVTDTTTTRLHTATQEIETKENTIDELKFEISGLEARVIELKQELADTKKDVESRDAMLNEKEESMKELKEKNNAMEELKSRLHTATEEILSKASKITQLEARHVEKLDHCENLSRELVDLKPKLQSEEERASTLAQNVSELTRAKSSLEQELKQTIVDMEDVREQLDEATKELAIKTAKISELEDTMNGEREIGNDLSSQLDGLRIDHANELTRANALAVKVQNLDENIAELKLEVARRTEEVDKTKSRMFDLTEELEAKCSKISGLEVLLANEESRCEELTAELDEIKIVLETAEAQIAKLTEDKTHLETRKATLEVELEENTAKVAEVEANLEMVMEERQDKITENITLEGLLSDKYTEIESLNAEIMDKTAAAERAVELEQEVQKTCGDLLAARTKSDELRGDISQLNSKLSAANMEIKKYQTRAKTVEKWVSSFALSIQGWRLESGSNDADDLFILDSSSAAEIYNEIDEC